jgi:hypothetical protein
MNIERVIAADKVLRPGRDFNSASNSLVCPPAISFPL